MVDLLVALLVGGLAGGAGGLMAGVAGVGGGLIYLPVFYLFLPATGHSIGLHVFASMMAVALTGFHSARAHWRLGNINRQLLLVLAPGLIIGAAIGLWSVLSLPKTVVLFSMGLLDFWVAWDIGRPRVAPTFRSNIALFSLPIGYISGTIGVGGGTLLVPLLQRKLPLRQAVGTSAALGLTMSLFAVMINLLAESRWQNLLAENFSVLAALLLGVLLVMPMAARYSAQLHTRYPEQKLRPLLRGLFMVLGLLLWAAAASSFWVSR